MVSSPPINFREILLELVIYTVFTIGYVALILNFISEPILGLYENNAIAYTAIALLFILGQGILLESITTSLIKGST